MELQRSIEIAASPARVWEVMTDVARWPEWTPSVKEIRFLDAPPLREGSAVRIDQPRLLPARYRVTALEPGRAFSWSTGNALVRVVASHTVEPSGAGARATLSVRFGGLLGALVGRRYARLTREYLDLEAEGLRARSERTR
jgi:hypothetical protein